MWDEETGDYYLRSRYYRPEWCRFISADTLIKRCCLGYQNLFSYCCNIPIVAHDSEGTDPVFNVGFVAVFTDIYELNTGSLLENYEYTFYDRGIQPGTFCEIIDINKKSGCAKVKCYKDVNKPIETYIPVKTLDLTWSYNYDSQERIFGDINNSCGYYHQGSRGEEILLLNKCLNRYLDRIDPVSYGQLLYSHVPVTDKYTPATENAVRTFQMNMGLDADGLAGPKTLFELEKWIKNDNGRG